MTREPIVAALFAKVAGATGLVTSSRTLKHFSEVQPQDQPALFVSPVSQMATRTRGIPTRWTLDIDIYIYVSRETVAVPDTALNTILDSIESSLAPLPAQEVQTLGGLCEHCWIEGAIQIDIGALGSQVLCTVPIRILVVT
jgi:hypothetical protein